MAASRFSRVSRARYTSPMPTASAGGTISYGPSIVPEATVIGARNYNPVRQAAVDATTLADCRLHGNWKLSDNFKVVRHPEAGIILAKALVTPR